MVESLIEWLEILQDCYSSIGSDYLHCKATQKIEDGLEESEKKHNCVCIGKGLQTLHNEHVKLPI